ncbi:Gfo/Idh/MocA family protein, partial [Paeniglutamicibacter kerguelensis]
MDLKVGVVGFGLRSGLYEHAHRPGAGSVVTMVCDTSERGRADAAKKLPEARITADLGELLDAGLDAVLVLTPDNQHAVVAKRTLEAGIPTFCEKPLDVTLDAVDEVLETAFRTGTKLYVGHNMRHMPVV